MAYREKLTETFTRRYFDEVFCPQLKDHSTFSLCVLDVDNFKAITYGHLVGDDMLQQMNQRIQALLSATDLLVQIVFLLPHKVES